MKESNTAYKIVVTAIPVASLLLIGYLAKVHNPGYIAYTILGVICGLNAFAFFKIAGWTNAMIEDDEA